MITKIPLKINAKSKSPSKTALYIAREIVSVLPIIFPPSIKVIPTSPSALAEAINNAAKREFFITGKITKNSVFICDFPLIYDASMISFGNESMADCSGFTIKGIPAINPAITRPLKENINEISY